jgi:peptidoglycan/xylan/chitin deacetylase (PgdA/CDA1 family)
MAIVGGALELLPESGQKKWKELQSQWPNRLHWHGEVPDLAKYIQQADLVIGSGRVAIEALALGKTILAFGESCYIGPVNQDTWKEACATNFGDIKAVLPLDSVNWELVQCDLIEEINNNPSQVIIQKVLDLYDAERVYESIQEVYRSLIWQNLHPKHIPVLMYHKIPLMPIESKHRIFVTKDVFATHIQYLKRLGYKTLTFQEYDDYKSGKLKAKNFPKKPVILTFDDGYKDNLTQAMPIMKAAGMKGVIFVLADRTQTKNFWDVEQGEPEEMLLTKEELIKMQDAGWELASHTYTHRDLTLLNDTELAHELVDAKVSIESEFGTKVVSFAYPYGKFDERVKEEVARAGYKYAVVIDSGGLHLEEDSLEIFRVYMFPEDGLFQIRKKSASWYRSYFRKKRGR